MLVSLTLTERAVDVKDTAPSEHDTLKTASPGKEKGHRRLWIVETPRIHPVDESLNHGAGYHVQVLSCQCVQRIPADILEFTVCVAGGQTEPARSHAEKARIKAPWTL